MIWKRDPKKKELPKKIQRLVEKARKIKEKAQNNAINK